jgi:hypothetical protein
MYNRENGSNSSPRFHFVPASRQDGVSLDPTPMKFIKDIKKYSYNYNLIDNIELFIKLNNGIQLGDRDKYWHKNGLIHRENDKPAIEYPSKNKEWWINGLRHRENDKPAVEWKNGYKQWWINGELHRENDKPAIESADGRKVWYINGKFIKRNYDENGIFHNNKFFDKYGNEIHK